MNHLATIAWDHVATAAGGVALWIVCVVGYALWLGRNNRRP